MISPFIVNDKNLFLSRFPAGQVNRSLQAWDSADEYVINYLKDRALINVNTKVLVFNDAFGALTTSFCHNSHENPTVFCVNDSYISQQGIQQFIEQNSLNVAKISLLWSLVEVPKNIYIVFFNIEKSN
jgi:16S rRNA (guanine1207-N2)-methyltransferase/23S rRNA (guanine1835-N2)-methyltransferase